MVFNGQILQCLKQISVNKREWARWFLLRFFPPRIIQMEKRNCENCENENAIVKF